MKATQQQIPLKLAFIMAMLPKRMFSWHDRLRSLMAAIIFSISWMASAQLAETNTAHHEIISLSNARQVVTAMGEALFGVALLVAIIWAIRRAKRWMMTRSTRFVAERTAVKVKSPGLRSAGLRIFVAVLRTSLNFVSFLLIVFALYAFVWYELRRFPYSRPWGDYLRSQCASVLVSFGYGILSALPDLLIVVFIVLAARMFAQALSRVFATAEKAEMGTQFLDPATAATTRRLMIFLVWVIAVVVAYPYIPGSQTPAFKGVTVFTGLLISLGSTNIIGQIASGLLLIYSRAFRSGDYVRVGEHEGTVLGIGMCATRICTVKNEQVHIANSVLLGTATKNYTRLAKSQGLLLPVTVTIGYNTPWRQVHAMLLKAADQTNGLARNPPPFVLQSGLSDFYVEYELNAQLLRPERRVWVLSDLHCHIQDIFNEYGVQIMSPHYLQDPSRPHIVPKSCWYQAPANRESADDNFTTETNLTVDKNYSDCQK